MTKSGSSEIPVLLLTYRRPETTRRVIDALRKIKPRRIFYATDAPNPNRIGEEELCEEVRKLADTIDWPCDVTRRRRKINSGLRDSVNSSIDWFFDEVDHGIILEDDCVPSPDFFSYCSELLEKYSNHHRVAQISGNNHDTSVDTNLSFRFSRYPHIWGWATWADRWKSARASNYSRTDLKDALQKHFSNETEVTYWLLIHDCVTRRKIDTWDFPWLLYLQFKDLLSATPSQNLVENIGFGEGATHTTRESDGTFNRPASSMTFPLTFPASIEADAARDKEVARQLYRINHSARTAHAKLRLTKWMPTSLKRWIKNSLG